MLLLRVQLPDRPGSLGVVATAMGTVGADIHAIEIVQKRGDVVVNDFMVNLPPTALPDSLVSVCNELDGVKVLWLSRYPDNWGLQSDIELLDEMTGDPSRATAILTANVPTVFHCQWAAQITPEGEVRAATDLAPEFDADNVAVLGPLDELSTLELDTDWLPGWGPTVLALVPLGDGTTLVVGRQGGPGFLTSELRRLQHLAALAR